MVQARYSHINAQIKEPRSNIDRGLRTREVKGGGREPQAHRQGPIQEPAEPGIPVN